MYSERHSIQLIRPHSSTPHNGAGELAGGLAEEEEAGERCEGEDPPGTGGVEVDENRLCSDEGFRRAEVLSE